MQETRYSSMNKTRKNFLITTQSPFRTIKQKPILGIDYDKLGHKDRKNNELELKLSHRNADDLMGIPKDSLIVNKTSHTFRPSTNRPSKQINHVRSMQKLEKPNSEVSDIPENIDFETFKKYQKEFEEFRRFKQQQKIRKLMQSSEYPKQDKDILDLGKTSNVYKRLYQKDQNLKDQNDPKGMTRSLHFLRNPETNNQKSNFQSGNPGETQYIEKHGDKYQNEQSKENEKKPYVKFSMNNLTEKQIEQILSKKSDDPLNSSDQLEQIEKADLEYELKKAQEFKEDSNILDDIEDHAFVGIEKQNIDPNSTAYARMVHKYMSKNPEYYKHLQGDCICGRCICGQCKCPYSSMPIDFKRGMKSQYQQDFQKQKDLGSLPQITMDFHTQVQKLDKIKCNSTTQDNFRPYEVKETVHHKAPVELKPQYPFVGSSHYQNNYVDWKSQIKEKIPNPTEPRVVPAPFVSKTQYMANFKQLPARDKLFEEFIKMKHQSQLNPMSPDLRFLNETNYQFCYKGNKQEKTLPLKPLQFYQHITPSAPDQFRSTFVRAYDDKSSIICPSRIELQELKRKKQQEKYKEYLERERIKNTMYDKNKNKSEQKHS